MDKLEAMKRFILVAKKGSFTACANQLNLPKASISQSIKSLEEKLGVRLLNRNTRSISLTSDGEIYLAKCEAILEEITILETYFQEKNEVITGLIRVDMPSRFLTNHVLPHLSSWFALYPKTTFQFSSKDYLIDPVKEGIDCLVRVGKLNESPFIAKKIGSMRLINCISPLYQKQYGTPSSLEALSHHFLIYYMPNLSGETHSFFEYLDKNNQLQHLAMKSLVTIDSTEAYFSACLAGLGIAQIPLQSVKKELALGTLQSILPQYEAEPMPISILYPSRKHLPRRVRFFIDWLHQLSPFL